MATGQQKIVTIREGAAGISAAARLRRAGESYVALIDTTKERRDVWLLKRRGLAFMDWKLILEGRA